MTEHRAGRICWWLFGLCLPTLWTGEASALSCLPPTVESVFSHHHDSPDRYVMGVGTIAPVDPLPTFNPHTLQHEPPGRFRATFEGRLAGETGFDPSTQLPISVERACFDEVCGFLPLARPAVMFLEEEGDGYVLHTNYCSDTMLPDPTEADLDRLIVCLREDACAESPAAY